MEKPHKQYTVGEEVAHSVTHGIGALLSIAGLAVMVALAALRSNAWAVVGAAIFGTTLILQYASSTFYHAFTNLKVKTFLRKCDHSAIFLLIAGTYTPFMLVNLRGGWGWSLFGVVWGMAFAGIILKVKFTGRFKVISTSIYIFMGWLIVIAFKPLAEALPPISMTLLVVGGICYTAGAIFYLMKKMPYHHAIWHLFVLGGSIVHYFSVLYAIIP